MFGGDENLTTALLDRLAEQASVVTTKGKSYRMRKRKDGGDVAPPAAPPSTATESSEASKPTPKPPKKR